MKARGRLIALAAGKTGSVVTCEIAIRPEDLEELNGQDVNIEISSYRKKRSLNANSYFHALCSGIGGKLGLSLTEVKNRMISDYGQIDRDMGALILRDDIDWKRLDRLHLHPTAKTQTMADGRLYRCYLVMRGSHTYDSREMGHLIEGTQEEARAVGVQTLDDLEAARMIEKWEARKGERI